MIIRWQLYIKHVCLIMFISNYAYNYVYNHTYCLEYYTLIWLYDLNIHWNGPLDALQLWNGIWYYGKNTVLLWVESFSSCHLFTYHSDCKYIFMCSYVSIKALSVVNYVMFIFCDQWHIYASMKGGCRIVMALSLKFYIIYYDDQHTIYKLYHHSALEMRFHLTLLNYYQTESVESSKMNVLVKNVLSIKIYLLNKISWIISEGILFK